MAAFCMQPCFRLQRYIFGLNLYAHRMKTLLVLDQLQLQILTTEAGALRQHCQLQISLLLHTQATVSLLSCPNVNCHVDTLSSGAEVLQSCCLIQQISSAWGKNLG